MCSSDLPLMSSSKQSNLPMIEWADRNGMTALHFACAYHSSSLGVKILLERNALLDVKDRFGRMPLHVAVGSGNVATVQILLTHASQPSQILHAADQQGRLPADYVTLADCSNLEKRQLEDWIQKAMQTHPQRNPTQARVSFVPLPELPECMRPQTISLSGDKSDYPIQLTPRKLRKKSESNITVRAATPHSLPVEARPSAFSTPYTSRASPIPLNDNKPSTVPRRAQTPSRQMPGTRCNQPPSPQRAVQLAHSLGTRESSLQRVGTPARPSNPRSTPREKENMPQPTTPRKRTAPANNQIETPKRTTKVPIGRTKYQYSTTTSVFERLNAHAVARNEVRKAFESRKNEVA